MAIDKVIAHLDKLGLAGRVQQFDVSSATVALAAQALGCEGARIAKTLSFLLEGIGRCSWCRRGRQDRQRQAQGAVSRQGPDDPCRAGGADDRPRVGGCPFGVDPDIPVYLDAPAAL